MIILHRYRASRRIESKLLLTFALLVLLLARAFVEDALEPRIDNDLCFLLFDTSEARISLQSRKSWVRHGSDMYSRRMVDRSTVSGHGQWQMAKSRQTAANERLERSTFHKI